MAPYALQQERLFGMGSIGSRLNRFVVIGLGIEQSSPSYSWQNTEHFKVFPVEFDQIWADLGKFEDFMYYFKHLNVRIFYSESYAYVGKTILHWIAGLF